MSPERIDPTMRAVRGSVCILYSTPPAQIVKKSSISRTAMLAAFLLTLMVTVGAVCCKRLWNRLKPCQGSPKMNPLILGKGPDLSGNKGSDQTGKKD